MNRFMIRNIFRWKFCLLDVKDFYLVLKEKHAYYETEENKNNILVCFYAFPFYWRITIKLDYAKMLMN